MSRACGMSFRGAIILVACLTVMSVLTGGVNGDQLPQTDAGAPPENQSIQTGELVLGVNWTVDRSERVEQIAADAPVRVVNNFGDLRLRATDDDELMVVAASQYSLLDDVRPVVDISEDADGVRVNVRFPSPGGEGPDLTPAEIGKRRVDLAVIIPGRGEVEVESLDGLVEAKGVRGPVAVRSRSGSVRMIARNDLDLWSEHGPVEVYFKAIETFPELAVETLTGDIRVEFPAWIDRTVRAETNGYLATDFTTTIEKTAGSPHKIAHVTIGNGGGVVQLTSNLGMISILEQPQLTAPVSQ